MPSEERVDALKMMPHAEVQAIKVHFPDHIEISIGENHSGCLIDGMKMMPQIEEGERFPLGDSVSVHSHFDCSI
jgi:hypothetical protein